MSVSTPFRTTDFPDALKIPPGSVIVKSIAFATLPFETGVPIFPLELLSVIFFAEMDLSNAEFWVISFVAVITTSFAEIKPFRFT